MKFRNIFLIMFLLLASLSYSFNSESRNLETSSDVEFNQKAIVLDAAVSMESPEIVSFNKISILEKESGNVYEVLVVLKYPNSSVVFSHSFEKSLSGYHSNLKETLFCCRTDRFIKVA